MTFTIACWDLQKPVAIIEEGFKTFLYHVHANFQKLHSYNNVLLVPRATEQQTYEHFFPPHLNAPL